MSGPVAASAARPQRSPEPDGGVTPDWVAAERGACPMCGLEFDDPVRFSHHLGEVHSLYDDEGKATDFGELAVPVAAEAPAEPAIDAFARAERSKETPQLARPIGLLACVFLLLGVLGAMIAFTGRGGDDQITADGDTRGTRSASASDGTDTDSTVGTATPPTGDAAAGVTSASPASPASGSATPASPSDPVSGSPNAIDLTTTTPPPPATTQPPSGFTAPLASGARMESCERVRNEWHVTYSWTFSGGAGWAPAAAYTALAGGRYQHTIAVPRRKEAQIATVSVTETKGRPHDVPLTPRLSTASC